MDNIINIINLTKQFDGNNILNNISFNAKQGEIIGLLGLNGAGKTTFLKLLSGLIEPTEGEILILGKKPWDEPDKILKNIGIMIETPMFYEHLTAFENIEIKATEEQNKGLTSDKSPILRKLDIKQRKILELFTEYQEITSIQAGQYLGISAQSARLLLNKWVETGFLRLANIAKKNRTYALATEYESLLAD